MRRAVLLGLIVSGCASQDVTMRPAAAPRTACDSDAYVVFVRPTRGGGAIEVREADGTLLGRLENQTYFGTPVSPGEHFFVARTDRDEGRAVALKADLAPGETYYVDAELAKGFAVLYAMAPRMPYWKELDDWLARSRPIETDPAAGRAAPDGWSAAYSYALRWWGQLDDQHISERKLILSDGVVEPTPLVTLSPEACATRAARPNPPPAVVTLAAADPGKDKDVPKCRSEKQTGSNLRTRVCRTDREAQAEYEDAWQFMNLPRVLATPPGN